MHDTNHKPSYRDPSSASGWQEGVSQRFREEDRNYKGPKPSRIDRKNGSPPDPTLVPESRERDPGMFRGEDGGDHNWSGAGASEPTIKDRKPTL